MQPWTLHGAESSRWLDGVIAAVLTPFDSTGNAHTDQLAEYVGHVARAGVSGIAVGAHTGRGHLLPPSAHVELIGAATGSGLPVVATACLPQDAASDSRAAVERALLGQAESAAAAGAAAVLCLPPPAELDPDPAWVARLHHRLAEHAGLPVIAFVLYSEAAANVTYGADHLAALTDVPGVVAVKIATLHDAIACQDAITFLRERAPHLRVLTGEDRMFGPSLMWGATGALVGVAAARTHLSVDLVRSWQERRTEDFLAASAQLDDFARLTFTEPVDGYVQRLAWAAAHEGMLPERFAHDPAATPAVLAERAGLLGALDALGAAPLDTVVSR